MTAFSLTPQIEQAMLDISITSVTDDTRDDLVTYLADGAPMCADFWEYFNDYQTILPQIVGYPKMRLEGGKPSFCAAVATASSENLPARHQVADTFIAEVNALAQRWAKKVVDDWVDEQEEDDDFDLYEGTREL